MSNDGWIWKLMILKNYDNKLTDTKRRYIADFPRIYTQDIMEKYTRLAVKDSQQLMQLDQWKFHCKSLEMQRRTHVSGNRMDKNFLTKCSQLQQQSHDANDAPDKAKATCQGCHRSPKTCLCPFYPESLIDNERVQLVVLVYFQCPTKMGTVHILQKTFKHCAVFVGYDFSQGNHPALDALLGDKDRQKFLLFPSKQSVAADTIPLDLSSDKLTLIIIDGTWAQAKKIFHSNSWLHQYPQIKVDNVPESAYGTFKKEPQEGFLSTCEAAAAAIQQIGSTLNDDHLQSVDLLSIVQRPMLAMIEKQRELEIDRRLHFRNNLQR
ncbi:hypothetical protein MIR68_009299 [Amoeboaphelidium protococcarum]|nr:hypothetical protein MIR68_009299 [Amoeboaphelidium protococcarum]